MISALTAACCPASSPLLLSAFTTAYLFMTPPFSVAIDHSDIFRLIVFAAVSLCGAHLGECAHQNAERHVADWKTVERNLADPPELHATHALCPQCSVRHFPEFHAPTV